MPQLAQNVALNSSTALVQACLGEGLASGIFYVFSGVSGFGVKGSELRVEAGCA